MPKKKPTPTPAGTRPRVITTHTHDKIHELSELVNMHTHEQPRGCILLDIAGSRRFSVNSKGYVQIAVKRPFDKPVKTYSNTKLQLHQLVAWTAPDDECRKAFQNAITQKFDGNGALEFCQLCHNKA
ncbi:hypothetical protein HDU97_007725 [Phlyctochytrium planicorne]|nr:hypothetical protein HDU97_007725 [Phlyctochytrium planicorne]